MTSHDACTSRTSRVLTVASLKRLKLEALIPAPADCEVRSVIKFLNAEHSAYRNSSLAVPGLWPHTARRSTHLLQEFGWQVYNHQPSYSPDLAHSDFHLSLHLKKFLYGQRQRFQNGRKAEMSVTDFYDTEYRSWSHSMNNISISVSVPINIPIKLGFVSVNCPRETYFLDELRSYGEYDL